MANLIKYADFISDLKSSIEFSNDEPDVSSGIRVRLHADGSDHAEIYGLDKTKSNNFFYYKGEKLSWVGDHIVSYQHDSILRMVQGFIDEQRLSDIEKEIKNSLKAYGYCDAVSNATYFNYSNDFDNVLRNIAEYVYRDILKIFADSVIHTIDTPKDYPDFDIFTNSEIELTTSSNHDWSYEFFKSYFDLRHVLEVLFNGFNPFAHNSSYHQKVASSIAWKFRKITILKSGLRFNQPESWCCIDQWSNPEKMFFNKEWRYKLPFLHKLITCFEHFGEYGLSNTINEFLNSDFQAGSTDSKNGISIKVYKEHYNLTLSDSVRDVVLVYLNKYAADDLAEAIECNDKAA